MAEFLVQPIKRLIPALEDTAQNAGTYTSADVSNKLSKGVKLYLFVNSITAGSITFSVEYKDPTSGTYFSALSSSAIAAASTTPTTLTVYPGITAAANASISDVLPDTWRVKAVIATGPAKASIAGSLID